MKLFFIFFILTACTQNHENNHREYLRPPNSSLKLELQKNQDGRFFATYNQEPISHEQIIDNNPVIVSIEKQISESTAAVHIAALKAKIYQEKLHKLANVIINRALIEAAKKENKSVNDYLIKHLNADPGLTEAEFNDYLSKKNIKPEDLNNNEHISLHAIVLENKETKATEDYVIKNLIKNPIYVHQFPPKAELTLPEEWQGVWGIKDSPITIIYFGDFSCGPCKKTLNDLIALEKKFRGHIKIGFNFFFPNNDRYSVMMAEAALCVYQQSTEKFGVFAKSILLSEKNSENIDEPAIAEATKESLAEPEQFKSCFYNRTHKALLNQHLDYAKSIGIVAPPTVLIEGEPLEGAITLDELTESIVQKIHSKSSWFGAFKRRFQYFFTRLSKRKL